MRRIALAACFILIGFAVENVTRALADNPIRPAPAMPGKKPSVKILYGGTFLNGRTFVFPTRAGLFALSSWQLKNDGSEPLPAGSSVRLYFSGAVGGSAHPTNWEQLTSTDPAFPAAFLWRSPAAIRAGESSDLPEFENSGAGLIRSVKGKLVVSAGADTLAEAIFLIRPVKLTQASATILMPKA